MFSVVTDTSANLPSALIAERNIELIPFSYYVEGEEKTCLDTESFDGKAYYDAMRNGVKVTTSQVTPQRYMEYMEPLLQQGKDLLFVGMSSGISGSYEAAQVAAAYLLEKYPERTVKTFDTLAASLGEGIFVLKAAECRDCGKTMEETLTCLEELRPRLCQIFTVDDLMFLRRSGRLSNFTAIMGTVLNIKPLLKGNEEGKIVTFAKVRGRRQSVEALAQRYDAWVKCPEGQAVCIAHAGCEEDARYLEDLLRRNHPPKEILTVCYEPVTGSHVGPGTLALFFQSEDGVRSRS
ncbi:MAG: DegV family protein [Clostridia bacterium]|nr:DegV family protein [Clostridia bacterium]